MGGQHHTEPDPQNQQTQMLGAAPVAGAHPAPVFVGIGLGGLGSRWLGHRLRLDVGQGFLLVEQVISRGAGATRGGGAAVLDDGGGSKVAWVPDRCQIIFGVHQARRGGAPMDWLRGFPGAPPMCVMRLTGHACQGKGIWA